MKRLELMQFQMRRMIQNVTVQTSKLTYVLAGPNKTTSIALREIFCLSIGFDMPRIAVINWALFTANLHKNTR